jgi:hypothetical protein
MSQPAGLSGYQPQFLKLTVSNLSGQHLFEEAAIQNHSTLSSQFRNRT